MDLSSDKIQKILSKYKFRDVAIEELQKFHRIFPEMIPSTGTYTFTDSTQKDLLKLIGNLPVQYEGRTYNFPVQLWLLDSFPFTPPICLLRPTANMVIREGKHVDARGRIFLPGLQNWDYPKSSVVSLLKEMTAKFEEDPPLSSKAPADSQNPQDLLNFVTNLQINDSGSRHQGKKGNKVSVIGGGDLGMASVMSIISKCKVEKLAFIDVADSSTRGGSTDLEIFSLPNVEVFRDLSASAGSRVIVVTANAWSGEQSYVSVVQTNVDMYRGLIPHLARLSPDAVMIIASQPVDIMAHVAWRQSGLPPTRVIGAGCNLDSERLSHILDINLNTHKQAWVIGELSDNKIPVMSNTRLSLGGQSDIASGSSSTKPVLDRAFEMMKNRGQRSWSVGLSMADITNSILTDKNKVHSVSTLAQVEQLRLLSPVALLSSPSPSPAVTLERCVQGWCGIGAEVFLSLPCSMGSSGSTRLAGVSLGPEEDAKLRASVASLSNLMGQLKM